MKQWEDMHFIEKSGIIVMLLVVLLFFVEILRWSFEVQWVN